MAGKEWYMISISAWNIVWSAGPDKLPRRIFKLSAVDAEAKKCIKSITF